MFIVKRIVPPPAGSSTNSYEYLTNRSKWTAKPSEARTFSNKGHAKNALREHCTYRRSVAHGDRVFICEVVLHTKNAEEYIVP